MAKITSAPFLLGTESFVAETDGDSSTIVRIAKGKAITQTEKEIAGDYYNAALDTIDYAKIYNLDYGANFLSKLGASDQWMGTALTDPMYKDAFKKATGKNSPNISFISPETNTISSGNLSSINKNANGKSTSKGGGFTARYPLNEDRKEYDYLQVTALEYEPAKFNSGSNLTSQGITEEAENRSMNPIGSVFLPMQPGLGEQSSVSWNNSSMNFLEAAGANISGGAVSGASEGMKKSIEKAMAAGGKAVNDLKGIGSDDVAAYFAGKAIGKNVFTRGTGQVVNPNLELLFDSPVLRSFNYTYRFTPREEDEAQEVKRIIKFFKKQMAPKRTPQKIFLKSPNVFRLKYMFKNGQEHPFLNKIKKCALTSFAAQYTPDGSYMTYDDGSMTSYTVRMDFGELNPIYEKDIDESSNDMGF